MKVKATQGVVASISGSSVRLIVGEIYDIPDDDADNLIRGRYAEAVMEVAEATEVKQAKTKKAG